MIERRAILIVALSCLALAALMAAAFLGYLP